MMVTRSPVIAAASVARQPGSSGCSRFEPGRDRCGRIRIERTGNGCHRASAAGQRTRISAEILQSLQQVRRVLAVQRGVDAPSRVVVGQRMSERAGTVTTLARWYSERRVAVAVKRFALPRRPVIGRGCGRCGRRQARKPGGEIGTEDLCSCHGESGSGYLCRGRFDACTSTFSCTGSRARIKTCAGGRCFAHAVGSRCTHAASHSSPECGCECG